MSRLYRIATHSLFAAGFLSAVWLALLSPPAQTLGSWLALKAINRSEQWHIEAGELHSNLLNELGADGLAIGFAAGPLDKVHVRHLQLRLDPLALFGSGSPLVRLYASGLHFYLRSNYADTTAKNHSALLPDTAAALLPSHLARWLPLEMRLRDISVQTERDTTQLTIDGLLHWQTEWSERHNAQFELSSSALALAHGTRRLDDMHLFGQAKLDRHALHLEELTLSTNNITLKIYGTYGADQFDAFANLQGPIQPLQHLIGGLRGAGQIDIRLHAMRESGQVRGDLTAGAHTFSYAGLPVEDLGLAGRYSDGDLYLDSLRIAMAGGRFDGSGRINLDTPSYPLTAHLAATDIDAQKLGALLAAEHLAMRGLLQGRAHIGANLAPATLLRADLNLDSPDLYIGKAHPGNTRITARFQKPDLRLHLNSEAGRLHVSGQILDTDHHAFRWRLHNFDLARTGLTSLGGEIDLSATSSGHWQHPQVALKAGLHRLRWGSFRLRQLNGQVHLDSSYVFASTWRAPHSDLQLEATGNLHSGADAIGLHLDAVPLSHLLSPAVARRWRAQLGLDLALVGGFANPQVRSQFYLDGIRYKGQLLGDIHGQLDVADGRSQLSISALDSTVSLQGKLQIEAAKLPFELAGDVEGADLAPLLRIAARRELTTTGRASGRLRATGHLKNLLQMHLDLDLEDLQVSLPMGQVHSSHPAKMSLRNGTIAISDLEVGGTLGRLHLDGRIARRGTLAFKLDLEDFQLDALDPFLPLHNQPLSGQVRAAMSIGGRAHAPLIEGDIALSNLQYGRLELGDLRGRFSYANQRARMPDLELALRRGGYLRGEGEWPLDLRLSADTPSPSPREIQLNLRAENAVFDSLQGLPPHVEFRINGQVEVRGDVAHWEELRGALELDALELYSPRFTLKNALPIDLRLHRNSLRIYRLDLRLLEGEVERGQIRASGHMARDAESDLSIEALAFDLQSLSHFTAAERALAGTVDARLTLRGRPQTPHIQAQWKIANSQLDSLRLQLLEGSASYRDEKLDLHAIRAEIGNGYLEVHGYVPVDLRGELLANRPLLLALNASNLAVGPLLRSRAAWPRIEADMRMDLRIEGLLGSLLTNGSIALEKGHLRVENLETPFAFAGLDLVVDANRARLSSNGGTAAAGRWDAKGTALLHNAAIDSFALEFALQNAPLTVARVFDVRAGGQLRWHGTAQSAQIEGVLSIDRGLISAPINLRAATVAPPQNLGAAAAWQRNTALDVTLKMQSVQLQNNLMDMVLDGDLALAGNSARPILSGLVNARSGGRIFYLGHSFALERAQLRLDEHKPVDDLFTLFYYPAALDPALDIAAHTEIKAKNGNEYFVDVGVNGPFSTLDFSLHSDPPRSHVQILSLLSFGSDDVNLLDPEGAVLSQQNQIALSPDYLLRVANSRFSRVLGVDDISINANSFKPGDVGGTRITLTKQLSQRAEMTYSTSVGYASKGRVRLNYQLDDNIFLQTERDAEGESGMDLKLKFQFR